MTTEDYVSFEVAKLLKEKGLKIPYDSFRGVYINGIFKRLNPGDGYGYNHGDEIVDVCSLQMAMKWLREVHNIDIDIDAKVGILGRKVYLPTISTYRCREDSDRLMQKQFELRYKNDTAVVPALQYFNIYEEATEAAIKYCLENLI